MVNCDLFELTVQITQNGGKRLLKYSFHTDLPAGTRVILSCDRFFSNLRKERCIWVGHNEAIEVQPNVYGDYGGGTGVIDVDESDKRGADRFASTNSSFSAGIAGPVSDELTISLVVGSRQRLKAFGKNNSELSGQLVQDRGGIRVVAERKSVVVPMKQELQPIVDD